MMFRINLSRSPRRGLILLTAVSVAAISLRAEEQPPPWTSGIVWPEPKIVDPGPPGGVPSDAIVLFDGKDLSKEWHGAEKWKVENGYAIDGGNLSSRRMFGDCQLHLEFASPPEVKGEGQGRGNSGVYMMNEYEIQILDSHNNPTYFDGQCGSIYKQRPPLVNACRKPGEWQSYDIIFEAPRFDAGGKVTRPAYVTVLQNGVLIQNRYEIIGETEYRKPPLYHAHPEKGPVVIQFHGHPVRFRNIWIRELADPREDLLVPLRERMKKLAEKS